MIRLCTQQTAKFYVLASCSFVSFLSCDNLEVVKQEFFDITNFLSEG